MASGIKLSGIAKPTTSSNSTSTPIVPDTKVEGEVIYILNDGWVKGIELEKMVYKDNNAIFIFKQTGTNNTTFKYLQDPFSDDYIGNIQDEAVKDRRINAAYTTLMSIFKSFIFPSVVDEVANSFGDKSVEFEELAQALNNEFVSGKRLSTREVWLRMVFKEDAGVEPKFVVGKNAFLGNEKYHPNAYVNPDPEKTKYNDIMVFKVVEKQPDFVTPTMGLEDLTPRLDVSGFGDSNFTPDLNLLG